MASGITSWALLLEELEMAVVMLSQACEGSFHTEGDNPLPRLLDPAVVWVRNIPLPTLVAYRDKVFPREIHRILPLERPEDWVTCDSIGLFLETECRFPLEPEEDCCNGLEEHEFIPSCQRRGCGLTLSYAKNASVELVDLYRHFLLPEPTGPKLKLVCSAENRERWIVPSHFDAFLERLYHN